MTNELRRIRDQVTCLQCGNVIDREIGVFTDQAIRTENERLRARIAELEAAIKPFAEQDIDQFSDDRDAFGHASWATDFTYGDIRRARAAYEKAGK